MKKSAWLAAAFMIGCFAASASAQTATQPTTQPTTQPLRAANGFVIGVYSQPIASFQGWVNDGVNTFAQWETSTKPLEWWAGTATLMGAGTIRVPSTQPDWEQWDAGHAPAGGIAWALSDEPDGNNVTPAQLAASAAQYRAMKHPFGGAQTLPVWLNVRGGSINGMQPPPQPIAQYLATADWLAEDFYPVTGWSMPDKLLANGQILDQLRQLAPNKPVMCFIECSNQQLSWVPNDVGVTPAQMRAEIWDAVIHGAYGIIYFPQQIGNGFSFDARPAEIKTEMQAADALLKDLSFESGKSIAAPAPFEACERNYKGQPAYIVLNTSANAAALPNGTSVAGEGVAILRANPFVAAGATQSAAPETPPAQLAAIAAPPTQAQLAQLQSQIAALTQQVSSANATIAEYKALLENYSSRIVALNAQVAALKKK